MKYEHLLPAERLKRAQDFRNIGAEYRRNAHTISHKKWWQRLLFIHIDPRLAATFIQEAEKYEARAAEIEATLNITDFNDKYLRGE